MEQKLQAAGVRLVELRRKLAARTSRGKAVPGYEKNVEAIKEEIARLEAITAAPAESENPED